MDLIAMGLCIKRNREKKSITLAELALKTGVSSECLQSYEDGMQKPTAKELKKISKVIGVPLVALIHGGGVLRNRCIDKMATRCVKVKNFSISKKVIEFWFSYGRNENDYI